MALIGGSVVREAALQMLSRIAISSDMSALHYILIHSQTYDRLSARAALGREAVHSCEDPMKAVEDVEVLFGGRASSMGRSSGASFHLLCSVFSRCARCEMRCRSTKM